MSGRHCYCLVSLPTPVAIVTRLSPPTTLPSWCMAGLKAPPFMMCCCLGSGGIAVSMIVPLLVMDLCVAGLITRLVPTLIWRRILVKNSISLSLPPPF